MASIIDKCLNYTDFKGSQPSADYIPSKTKNHIKGKFIQEYLDFLEYDLADEAVQGVKKLAEEKDLIIGEPSNLPFFVTDKDMGMSRALGNAFALVKPGKKEKPLRIIISHTDVPRLRVVPQPLHIEPDAEKCLAVSSYSLRTEAYGGVRKEDWYGKKVKIIGKMFKGNAEYEVNLPGAIEQKSFHVEPTNELKKFQYLNVDTGFRTLKELYSAFEMKDSTDFGRCRLFITPDFNGGRNGRLTENKLEAGRQDDRAGVWASTKSFLKTLERKCDNTLIILGLDKEEVGSSGPSGAYKGFCEAVLKETLKIIHKKDYSKLDLPLDFQRGLLGDLPAIIADTDVAFGEQELEEHPYNLDMHNGALAGWGFFIDAHGSYWNERDVAPQHLNKLIDLMDKKLPGNHKRDRYRIIGKCTTEDNLEIEGSATMGDKFDNYFPCIEMGLPVIGLHHPTGERINIFDLYWLTQGYQTYLKS